MTVHLVRLCSACRQHLHPSCWQRLHDLGLSDDAVPCKCGCWDGSRTSGPALLDFVKRQPEAAAFRLSTAESTIILCGMTEEEEATP